MVSTSTLSVTGEVMQKSLVMRSKIWWCFVCRQKFLFEMSPGYHTQNLVSVWVRRYDDDGDDEIITCRWASCTASRTPSPSRSPPPPPTHSPGSPSTSLQVTGGSQGVFWSRVSLMSVFANESSYERWRRAEWEMLTQGFECSRSSPSQGRSSIFCDLVICLLTIELNSYWLRSI